MKWPEEYINQIICGDCLEVMKGMPSDYIDTIITDPPYGLEFMGKKWDAPWKGKAGKDFNTSCEGKLGGFKKLPNYMRGNNVKCSNCNKWKFSSNPCKCESPIFPHIQQLAMVEYQEWTKKWATEALRVVKPGATLLCFGGTRTYHRLACAIEDAGWIIKDCIMWLYGSGFPKATDISKQIDKKAGKERKTIGDYRRPDGSNPRKNVKAKAIWNNANGNDQKVTAPATPEATLWDGWKSHGLKPAYEPILMAMKPNEGSYANNALKWGVAGLNIDGGRIEIEDITKEENYRKNQAIVKVKSWWNPKSQISQNRLTKKGRYPANIILDEEAGRMLDEQSGDCKTGGRKIHSHSTIFKSAEYEGFNYHNREGGASRFFYCAKSSKVERNRGCEGLENHNPCYESHRANYRNTKGIETPYAGTGRSGKNLKNHHPTVKPLSLMKYLCTLTKTPTGGIVLDPFCGSGTTLMACKELKRDHIGIDNVSEYCEIARRRVNAIPEPLF